MRRRLDWPERLAAALEAARAREFSERYHCAAFAADVVLAMTDEDPLPERHETVAEAYAHIRRLGHETLSAAIAAAVGPEIPLAFARRGDVILRDDGVHGAIGICCGTESAFISDQGLAFMPTLEQLTAFRVPF